MTSPTIVWFRQDLRLTDNPALYKAVEKGKIVPLYILDENTPGQWKLGGSQKWWLHNTLESLSRSFISESGEGVVLKAGDPKHVLESLLNKYNAKSVYWNRCYEPFSIKRDLELKRYFEEKGIEVETFNASLLYEPWEIKNKQGSFYKVFTAFWKACLQYKKEQKTYLKPQLKDKVIKGVLSESDNLSDWNLLPKNPDWSGGISKKWTCGEDAAKTKLLEFIDKKISRYDKGRNFPDRQVTSELSPYLHWGEISPRQILSAVELEYHIHPNKIGVDNRKSYLFEIGWREFSYYLLYHFPELPTKPFNNKFDKFPWETHPKFFDAWKRGNTGYPIVDAGMRELWYTGTMHNRVRMIVASFLTKDLFIHWSEGERWFWDTLVDADLANNSASWQWVAGSGADAAPYFRVFNPSLQGERFDAEGEYIRKWVPEISNLSNKFIHKPWEAPKEVLEEVEIVLGKDYPKPVVDHSKMRDKALKTYKKLSSK